MSEAAAPGLLQGLQLHARHEIAESEASRNELQAPVLNGGIESDQQVSSTNNSVNLGKVVYLLGRQASAFHAIQDDNIRERARLRRMIEVHRRVQVAQRKLSARVADFEVIGKQRQYIQKHIEESRHSIEKRLSLLEIKDNVLNLATENGISDLRNIAVSMARVFDRVAATARGLDASSSQLGEDADRRKKEHEAMRLEVLTEWAKRHRELLHEQQKLQDNREQLASYTSQIPEVQNEVRMSAQRLEEERQIGAETAEEIASLRAETAQLKQKLEKTDDERKELDLQMRMMDRSKDSLQSMEEEYKFVQQQRKEAEEQLERLCQENAQLQQSIDQEVSEEKALRQECARLKPQNVSILKDYETLKKTAMQTDMEIQHTQQQTHALHTESMSLQSRLMSRQMAERERVHRIQQLEEHVELKQEQQQQVLAACDAFCANLESLEENSAVETCDGITSMLAETPAKLASAQAKIESLLGSKFTVVRQLEHQLTSAAEQSSQRRSEIRELSAAVAELNGVLAVPSDSSDETLLCELGVEQRCLKKEIQDAESQLTQQEQLIESWRCDTFTSLCDFLTAECESHGLPKPSAAQEHKLKSLLHEAVEQEDVSSVANFVQQHFVSQLRDLCQAKAAETSANADELERQLAATRKTFERQLLTLQEEKQQLAAEQQRAQLQAQRKHDDLRHENRAQHEIIQQLRAELKALAKQQQQQQQRQQQRQQQQQPEKQRLGIEKQQPKRQQQRNAVLGDKRTASQISSSQQLQLDDDFVGDLVLLQDDVDPRPKKKTRQAIPAKNKTAKTTAKIETELFFDEIPSSNSKQATKQLQQIDNVEKATKPVEAAAKPVEETAKPVEKAAKQVEKAMTPIKKATKHVEKAMTPNEQATKRAETTKHSDKSARTVEKATKTIDKAKADEEEMKQVEEAMKQVEEATKQVEEAMKKSESEKLDEFGSSERKRRSFGLRSRRKAAPRKPLTEIDSDSDFELDESSSHADDSADDYVPEEAASTRKKTPAKKKAKKSASKKKKKSTVKKTTVKKKEAAAADDSDADDVFTLQLDDRLAALTSPASQSNSTGKKRRSFGRRRF
ncbi:MAG: hypothetical protein MHM6MM_004043 [Cercozoa sp. M6MM]